MEQKNIKRDAEGSLTTKWAQQTIIETSSLTPVEQCKPLSLKAVHAFLTRNAPAASEPAPETLIQKTDEPVSALYSRALDIMQDYFQLILADKYNLHPKNYELWTEVSSNGVYAMQYVMPESSMLPDDEEQYFDPDLEEALQAFLDDLEESIGTANVVIDREALSIEFANKIDLYVLLYNYMSTSHQSISTPDRYGINMDQFDPEISGQQLTHLIAREKKAAQAMIDQGEAETLLTIAPGDFYSSREHFMARASMTMNVDIFIPLSQLLVILCEEDEIPLPEYYSTPTTTLYKFN